MAFSGTGSRSGVSTSAALQRTDAESQGTQIPPHAIEPGTARQRGTGPAEAGAGCRVRCGRRENRCHQRKSNRDTPDSFEKLAAGLHPTLQRSIDGFDQKVGPTKLLQCQPHDAFVGRKTCFSMQGPCDLVCRPHSVAMLPDVGGRPIEAMHFMAIKIIDQQLVAQTLRDSSFFACPQRH